MPVTSFSIAEVMPQLLSGLITYVPEVYQESFGLSAMAEEARPQIEPKIRVMGKVFKRYVASDIPEGSEAPLIKDTKFTDEMFTAPEYGEGFFITAEDLVRNNNYLAGFAGMTIDRARVATLLERVRNASNECINMIKRAADNQVMQILKTGTIVFDNYTTIDFGRDTDNSVVISTANRKWTIANASTMLPLTDIDDWTDQVATRGNAGGEEFFCIMGLGAYRAFTNSDQYKADSDIRRNYQLERLSSISAGINRNIPAGAVYRESIVRNPVGPVHIFTYDETYDVDATTQAKWILDNMVYIISSGNVLRRQPVTIQTMNDLIARSPLMTNALRATPSMRGWLVEPDWNRTTSRALVMSIFRKFLTQPLTVNKTFAATVADA